MSKEKELEKLSNEYEKRLQALHEDYSKCKKEIEEKYKEWQPTYILQYPLYSTNGYLLAGNLGIQIQKFYRLAAYLREQSNCGDGKVTFNYHVDNNTAKINYTFTVDKNVAIELEKKINTGVVKI